MNLSLFCSALEVVVMTLSCKKFLLVHLRQLSKKIKERFQPYLSELMIDCSRFKYSPEHVLYGAHIKPSKLPKYPSILHLYNPHLDGECGISSDKLRSLTIHYSAAKQGKRMVFFDGYGRSDVGIHCNKLVIDCPNLEKLEIIYHDCNIILSKATKQSLQTLHVICDRDECIYFDGNSTIDLLPSLPNLKHLITSNYDVGYQSDYKLETVKLLGYRYGHNLALFTSPYLRKICLPTSPLPRNLTSNQIRVIKCKLTTEDLVYLQEHYDKFQCLEKLLSYGSVIAPNFDPSLFPELKLIKNLHNLIVRNPWPAIETMVNCNFSGACHHLTNLKEISLSQSSNKDLQILAQITSLEKIAIAPNETCGHKALERLLLALPKLKSINISGVNNINSDWFKQFKLKSLSLNEISCNYYLDATVVQTGNLFIEEDDEDDERELNTYNLFIGEDDDDDKKELNTYNLDIEEISFKCGEFSPERALVNFPKLRVLNCSNITTGDISECNCYHLQSISEIYAFEEGLEYDIDGLKRFTCLEHIKMENTISTYDIWTCLNLLRGTFPMLKSFKTDIIKMYDRRWYHERYLKK